MPARSVVGDEITALPSLLQHVMLSVAWGKLGTRITAHVGSPSLFQGARVHLLLSSGFNLLAGACALARASAYDT